MQVELTNGIVEATLVKKTMGGAWVKLEDGAVIKRKNKKIVGTKEYIKAKENKQKTAEPIVVGVETKD